MRKKVEPVKLVEVFLRLRQQDVEAARKQAAKFAVPYSHIIRTWVAEGASLTQNGTQK